MLEQLAYHLDPRNDTDLFEKSLRSIREDDPRYELRDMTRTELCYVAGLSKSFVRGAIVGGLIGGAIDLGVAHSNNMEISYDNLGTTHLILAIVLGLINVAYYMGKAISIR